MQPFTEISIPGAEKYLQEHRLIKQVISRTVPASLLEAVQFCRIENTVLRITVGNAAVLSRLRFEESQIIDNLAGEKIHANSIKWHVSREEVRAAPRKKVPKAAKGGDARSAKLLHAIADDMPDDELRSALLKVAKHLD